MQSKSIYWCPWLGIKNKGGNTLPSVAHLAVGKAVNREIGEEDCRIERPSIIQAVPSFRAQAKRDVWWSEGSGEPAGSAGGRHPGLKWAAAHPLSWSWQAFSAPITNPRKKGRNQSLGLGLAEFQLSVSLGEVGVAAWSEGE